MKLSHEITANRITVAIRGEVFGSQCDCLEHFWDRYVDDPFDEVRIDMAAVDEIDSQGVAALVNLVRRNLAAGAAVVIDSPPQMLAHTLYKSNMLDGKTNLQILPRPREEPYAG